MPNIHKKMEKFSSRLLRPENEMTFEEWSNEVTKLIIEKQKHPFGSYRKNKWKTDGRIMKQMYKEGYKPSQAAGLWGLNHEIIKQ